MPVRRQASGTRTAKGIFRISCRSPVDKALRVRKTLVFEDAVATSSRTIRTRKLRIKDSMEIEEPSGRRLAMVKKALIAPLRDGLAVSVADGPGLEVQGNLLDY